MYLTNRQRDDGFGAQLQGLIYTIMFAECNNYPFAYSNIKKIDHNYENITNFVEDLENYINIKNNYINASSIDSSSVIEIPDGKEYVYMAINTDKVLESPQFKNLKTIIYKNKKSPFTKDTFNIAIHIRKFNKCDNRTSSMAPYTNQYYVKLINNLREFFIYINKPILFHIYSQGALEEFHELEMESVLFHLNESIQDTFNGFLFADLLVTGPSSFSYVAGLLTDSDVIYVPFDQHGPCKKWRIYR